MAHRGSCNWCSFVFKNLYALSPPLHERTPTHTGLRTRFSSLAVNCYDLLLVLQDLKKGREGMGEGKEEGREEKEKNKVLQEICLIKIEDGLGHLR